MKVFDKLLDWYLSRNALPYWVILAIDIVICYLSGIFVFWLYYHGAVSPQHIVLLSKTIFMYMIFNLLVLEFFVHIQGLFVTLPLLICDE